MEGALEDYVLPCLSGVSALAGGVVSLAYVVEPGLLSPSFATIPRVGAEGVSVPVCSPHAKPCLRAGSASRCSGGRSDPLVGGGSRVKGDDVGIYSHVYGTRDKSRDRQLDGWRQLGYETECPNGGNWEFSV